MVQGRLIGQNPWQRQPRTPGPLGVNDAASPFSGLTGPTPGPCGLNDDSPGCNLGPSLGLMNADDSYGGSSGAGACPDVEIEINDTPATTDDLVLLQYPISTLKPVTPCRLRAKSNTGPSFTVVLTNPDGRLHFTGDKNTLTINVPGGSVDWAEFEITGVKGSDKVGDAVIEAHCGSDTGPLANKKPVAVTVVWFDAGMAVKSEDSYSINGSDFNAKKIAVTLSAKADIRPKGVNCTAPQIVDLRVGIMQNTLPAAAKGRSKTALYGSPEGFWLPGAPIGESVQVPAQWQYKFEYSLARTTPQTGLILSTTCRQQQRGLWTSTRTLPSPEAADQARRSRRTIPEFSSGMEPKFGCGFPMALKRVMLPRKSP